MRHRFDPISFFFGVLFVAVAAWVIGGGSTLWSLPAQWLLPAVLFGAGLVLFGSVASRVLQDRRPPNHGDEDNSLLS